VTLARSVVVCVVILAVAGSTAGAGQTARVDGPSVRDLLQTARKEASAGNAAAALESLRKARALAPNSEEVLSAYAQLTLGARLLLPAILTLQSLTRICPTVAQYQYLLGVAFMEGGDMPAAIESLTAADRLEPENSRTLLALALARNSSKQYVDARTAATKSLDLDPENVDAVAALAEAEAGAGDVGQAADHAQRALARAPAHPTANLVMGIVFMQQEQYAAARDALERAVAAAPDSFVAHYQLSLAYARLGNDAEAQKHVALYQQKQREMNDRIRALRSGAAPDKRP